MSKNTTYSTVSHFLQLNLVKYQNVKNNVNCTGLDIAVYDLFSLKTYHKTPPDACQRVQ